MSIVIIDVLMFLFVGVFVVDRFSFFFLGSVKRRFFSVLI